MKLINFKISDDFIAIETEGKYFDLHNNFEFVGFNYLFDKRYFEINWAKCKGEWVQDLEPDQLTMKFENVSILRIKEIDQTEDALINFKSDDLSLSFIGFTSKEDNEFMGHLSKVNSTDENNPIAIQTQNGQAFIILSETVEINY